MIFVNAKFLTKTITGIERYAIEISHALKKIDPSIEFLTPSNYRRTNMTKELNAKPVIPWQNYLWEQITLPYYLKRNGSPCLVNLTNTAPVMYRNQILIIHDLAFLHKPEWFTKTAAVSFKYLVGQSARAAKKIAVVSEFSKSEVIKYWKIPPEKIKVIPGAVPSFIDAFKRKEYDNKYGDYILSVSSLEPRKNIQNLVKAFCKLNNPGLKLVIAGKSNSQVFSSIDGNLLKGKNIILTGYVSDEELVGFYKNARLFAYLSYYEGFGFPPLEAITCGCPVLAANTASLPEVCGDAAEYCNPDNVAEIALKMNEMLNNSGTNTGKNIETIGQKFSWAKSARMLINMIEEAN